MALPVAVVLIGVKVRVRSDLSADVHTDIVYVDSVAIVVDV